MGNIRVSRTDDGRFIARCGGDFVVSATAKSASAKLARFLRKSGPTNQIRFSRPMAQTVSLMAGQKSVRPTFANFR